MLSYTRNNAGGLKDAIDFLLLPFISRGLEVNDVKGAIPRPKSDSFEDNMPFFESKLLQRAEPPVTESPTRPTFGEEGSSRSIFDKLRKPGSMSSFSSFIDRRRKNGSNSPASLFMHASSNASKASLVSMESRDSGYRNPWNDSGIDLENDAANGHGHVNGATSHHGNGWGSFSTTTSRPNTSSNSLSGAFDNKFPFGVNGNASTSSLNTPMLPGLGMGAMTPSASGVPGDATPKYDAKVHDTTSAVTGNLSLTPVATAGAEPAAPPTISENTSAGYPGPIAPPH